METSLDTGHDPRETREVPVLGRNIVVQSPTDAQLLLLSREARLAQKEGTDSGRRLEAIARIFDILESAVVAPEDKEYLLDQVVKGDLHLSDLTGFVSAFNAPEEKAKVRRGRTPAKRA